MRNYVRHLLGHSETEQFFSLLPHRRRRHRLRTEAPPERLRGHLTRRVGSERRLRVLPPLARSTQHRRYQIAPETPTTVLGQNVDQAELTDGFDVVVEGDGLSKADDVPGLGAGKRGELSAAAVAQACAGVDKALMRPVNGVEDELAAREIRRCGGEQAQDVRDVLLVARF